MSSDEKKTGTSAGKLPSMAKGAGAKKPVPPTPPAKPAAPSEKAIPDKDALPDLDTFNFMKW